MPPPPPPPLKDNILIKQGLYKIADVGVARVLNNRLKLTDTLIGTPLYMAPEIFQGSYTFPVDLYALGCILKVGTALSCLSLKKLLDGSESDWILLFPFCRS